MRWAVCYGSEGKGLQGVDGGMLQAEDLGLSGSSVGALFEVERFVVAFCHYRSTASVSVSVSCVCT